MKYKGLVPVMQARSRETRSRVRCLSCLDRGNPKRMGFDCGCP